LTLRHELFVSSPQVPPQFPDYSESETDSALPALRICPEAAADDRNIFPDPDNRKYMCIAEFYFQNFKNARMLFVQEC